MKYFNWRARAPGQYPAQFALRRYVDLTRFTIGLVTFFSLLVASFYAFNFTPRYQAVVLLETRVIGSLNGVLNTSSTPIINATAENSLNQTNNSSIARNNTLLQSNFNKMLTRGDLDGTMGNWLREMAFIKTNQTLDDTIKTLALDVQKKPLSIPLFTPLSHWVWGIFSINFINITSIPDVEINSYSLPPALDGKSFSLKKNKQAAGYQLILPGMKPIDAILNENTNFKYDGAVGFINIGRLDTDKIHLKKYNVGDIEKQLNQNLTVKALDDYGLSNVIQIIYEDSNPKEAAKIANAIAASTIKLSKEREYAYAKEAKNDLLLQQKIVTQRLKKEEEIVYEFLLKTASADPTYESRAFIDQLAEIDKEIRLAEQQKIILLSTNTQNNFHVTDIDNILLNLHDKKYKIFKKITQRNIFDQKYSEMISNYQTDLALNQIIIQQTQRLNLILANPVGDIRIILAATPPNQNISYSRTLIILLGLIIGLIVGYILALAIE